MWKLIKWLTSYYTFWTEPGGGGGGSSVVDELVIFNGRRKYAVKYSSVSDGTDESGVLRLDISALVGPNGIAPSAVKLREISWSIQGYTSVRLHWDHDTNDEIVVLGAGNGYIDCTSPGSIMDPRSTGGTGDILFTTAGAVSGATYDITLVVGLKD